MIDLDSVPFSWQRVVPKNDNFLSWKLFRAAREYLKVLEELCAT
jgi:hypothetical protein